MGDRGTFFGFGYCVGGLCCIIVTPLLFLILALYKGFLLSVDKCLITIGISIIFSFMVLAISRLFEYTEYTKRFSTITLLLGFLIGLFHILALTFGLFMLLQNLAMCFVNPVLASILVVLSYTIVLGILIRQHFDYIKYIIELLLI